MNIDRFEDVVKEQLEICARMLTVKGDEYARPEDRLHNFKVASAMQRVTVPRAIGGMMAKHTVSIYDMLPDAQGYSMELWVEKITDHINYLLLLKAALMDMENEKPNA